jgi:quinol monooxygenase YgiN
MPIYLTARFRVRAESHEKCKEAIREFVDYIAQNEIGKGTISYTALQEPDDPTSFLHYFVFEDAAARDRHSNSDAVNKFTSALYPETLAPVRFTEYQVVASA